MNVLFENVPDPMKEGLDQLVKKALSQLKECVNEVVSNIQQDYLPLLNDFVKNMTGEMQGIAYGDEVDVLEMKSLIEFAKKYIVPNSNEIVAIKINEPDGYYVYMAYSNNRQLLPVVDNRYLIIKAGKLAKEVEELFANSNLVILK